MTIPQAVVPYINILIIAFLLISLLIGYKKGFFYQTFSLLSVLTSILVSWFFAPVLAESIWIFPEAWTPFAGTPFADVFYGKMNTLAWYLLLFIAVSLLTILLKPFADSLMELPILDTVNHILGALFSFVPAVVVWVLFSYFLSSPLVANGKEVLEKTWFGPVKTVAGNVIHILDEPYAVNSAIQKLTSDPTALTEEDIGYLKQWLLSENPETSEEAIQKFIEDYMKPEE